MKLLLISTIVSGGLSFKFSNIPRHLIKVSADITPSGFFSLSSRTRPLFATVEEKEVQVSDDELFGFDLPTNENNPHLLRVRHTTAHIMAMAVQKLFPEAQVTIGPWIDGGCVLIRCYRKS
jgi:hypothetical protein